MSTDAFNHLLQAVPAGLAGAITAVGVDVTLAQAAAPASEVSMQAIMSIAVQGGGIGIAIYLTIVLLKIIRENNERHAQRDSQNSAERQQIMQAHAETVRDITAKFAASVTERDRHFSEQIDRLSRLLSDHNRGVQRGKQE